MLQPAFRKPDTAFKHAFGASLIGFHQINKLQDKLSVMQESRSGGRFLVLFIKISGSGITGKRLRFLCKRANVRFKRLYNARNIYIFSFFIMEGSFRVLILSFAYETDFNIPGHSKQRNTPDFLQITKRGPAQIAQARRIPCYAAQPSSSFVVLTYSNSSTISCDGFL